MPGQPACLLPRPRHGTGVPQAGTGPFSHVPCWARDGLNRRACGPARNVGRVWVRLKPPVPRELQLVEPNHSTPSPIPTHTQRLPWQERRRDSPPVLPDELVEEIFLRLPPDEPAWLLRASLVSKAWGRAISSPAFRRRLHEFHVHRTPPVLGFLHNRAYAHAPRFIPTTASSFSLAAPDCASWQALDCRHGRALFLSEDQAQALLVWEPITGGQQRVPLPPAFRTASLGGAVLCAADGCDHIDCHGGPFRVVIAFSVHVDYNEPGTVVCVYSSEAGGWCKATFVEVEYEMNFIACSSVLLAGRSLLYFMSNLFILEYDLERNDLTVFDALDVESHLEEAGIFSLLLAEENGRLAVIQSLDQHLKLWTREVSDGSGAQWVLRRVINLGNLPPIGTLIDADSRVEMVGFAEGANIIFIDTVAGIFMVELQTGKARKVCDTCGFCILIPVVSFYTPVPRGEHQDPPLSDPSEEAGGEVGGEEEKAVEQHQQLFDKGSNAIGEGDFVNARFSHALNTRVPSLEEVALECATMEYGCAFLCKAQGMNDPLDDVPESASNEESMMGTTSKEDAGNSKTSVNNVEDAAPPQKGEYKEVLP